MRKECPLATSQEACTRCKRRRAVWVGWVDVREKREGGAVGAKGRAGGRLAIARALTGLGGDSGEAVAGGSAAAAERRGVYASSSI